MMAKEDINNKSRMPLEADTNDSCEQFDIAAMVLGQALLRFLERSNSRIAEKILEKLQQVRMQIS